MRWAYASTIELDAPGNDEAYLFYPATGAASRPMESSAWTQYVRRLFGRLTGTEIAPKTLRKPHALPNLDGGHPVARDSTDYGGAHTTTTTRKLDREHLRYVAARDNRRSGSSQVCGAWTRVRLEGNQKSS